MPDSHSLARPHVQPPGGSRDESWPAAQQQQYPPVTFPGVHPSLARPPPPSQQWQGYVPSQSSPRAFGYTAQPLPSEAMAHWQGSFSPIHGTMAAPPPSMSTDHQQLPIPYASNNRHHHRRAKSRAQLACDNCHARKAKCDESQPSCTSCTEEGLSCTYSVNKPPKVNHVLVELTRAATSSIKSLRHDVSNVLDEFRFDFTKPHGKRHMEREMTIPSEDATVAHKLLTDWSSITPFRIGIVDNSDYVLQGEVGRGVLRLYGRGEGNDPDEGPLASVFSPQPSNLGIDETSSVTSSAEGSWDMSEALSPALANRADNGDGRSAGSTTALNSHGISLDAETVRSLYECYLDNFYVIQPFLNKSKSDEFINDFISTYCHPYTSSFTSISTVNHRSPLSKPPSPTLFHPQRTVETVLVLMIMALGKICQHKGPLQSWQRPTPYGVSSQAMLPNRSLRNVDIIPGLVYYNYGASILGELQAGVEVAHMHMNMLAALYCAQFLRVFDSWKHINSACSICMILIRQHDMVKEDCQPSAIQDEIRLGFWSLIQLESDILAVLDLPPSGISRRERQMERPTFSAFDSDRADSLFIGHSYIAQLDLREILNRIHAALNNEAGHGWSNLIAGDLLVMLQNWRSALPPQLGWVDTDVLAANINAACLREKYYGARYLIYRPFLRYVLENQKDWRGGKISSKGELPDLSKSRIATVSTVDGLPASEQQAETDHSRGYFIQMALECIKAAIYRTTAFDGIVFENDVLCHRLVVTNLFGTAHARFGNMLVLSAAYSNPMFHSCVGPSRIVPLLMRNTLLFLRSLALISPTMATNVRILEQAERITNKIEQQTLQRLSPVSI